MFERPKDIEKCRIWVDGCFDFAHHGAMLQARQLGRELYVGIHTDEDILHNKGPVVMHLEERVTSVDACKWSTKSIPGAPYVTDPAVMEEYGCKYVVHGDDITTDADGKDCYQVVKDMGKFVVVKRTPNISTTDLVGRMLLMSKTHHYKPIQESASSFFSEENLDKISSYASDVTGLNPGSGVYLYTEKSELKNYVKPSADMAQKLNTIYYVDGGFDLFHPGHITALKAISEEAEKKGASVVVGIHDDSVINKYKGLNYPIMNLFERTLCVLQCRYVDSVVLGAPYTPTVEYLKTLPGDVAAVFHGPTPVASTVYDELKKNGLYRDIGAHKFDDMNTETIVKRVLDNKKAYEERQRRKGWKSEVELQLREKEQSSTQ